MPPCPMDADISDDGDCSMLTLNQHNSGGCCPALHAEGPAVVRGCLQSGSSPDCHLAVQDPLAEDRWGWRSNQPTVCCPVCHLAVRIQETLTQGTSGALWLCSAP